MKKNSLLLSVFMDYLFFIVISIVFVNCSSSQSSKEDSLAACSDEIDNDNDDKIDCEDEQCKSFSICMQCQDEDNDLYGDNCSLGEDCDDTSNLCNAICEDIDNDNVFDCKDDCLDNDNDNYGTGEGCIDTDCDDTIPSCNEECIDTDYDNIYDCNDSCIDLDRDNYGVGSNCLGADCDERSALCNVNCTTDENHNGKRDCDEDCIDNDGDGYGIGTECTGSDCDDTSITCNIECVLDTNNNGKRDCDEDCVDKDRDGYGEGEDCEDDCNDDDENNWTLCSQCKDNDNDSYYVMCNRYKTISGPDVDDNNPNCDIEATDSDNDEYCANHDCEDSLPECNIDCSDEDNDSIMDCNDCYNSPHEISHYFTHSQTSDIALKDNYVFLADGTNGLRIIDITDLKNPVETNVFGSDDWYVAVEGNYAYVAGSEGLRIINISQITSPREVGFLSFNRMFNDIIVRNNYVFLIEGTWGYEDENGFPYSYGGLQIVDVTDPEHPFEVSYYDTGGDANVLEITQIAGIDYAVVGVVKVTEDGTDITGGFSIIDLSNISAPNEINFQLLYPPDAMTIINGYLIINFFDFITPYNIIYDIVDPSSPQFVTEFIDDISIYALYSINDYLFAAGQGLIVYDLSSIESPQEIGSYTFEQGAFYNISYRDNHLFLSYFYIDWNEPNVYEGGLSIVSFLCGE